MTKRKLRGFPLRASAARIIRGASAKLVQFVWCPDVTIRRPGLSC